MQRVVVGSLVAVAILFIALPSTAQESKSAALAKELTAALDAGKLDSIAARDSAAPDAFIAALYFPGVQLLVVSGKYSAPQLLNERLNKKEFRDTYLDLSGASSPASRVVIEDLGADGLKSKHADNTASDAFESGGTRTVFDSDWKKQKMTEADYMKAFTTADERYAQLLTALVAQAKKK